MKELKALIECHYCGDEIIVTTNSKDCCPGCGKYADHASLYKSWLEKKGGR